MMPPLTGGNMCGIKFELGSVSSPCPTKKDITQSNRTTFPQSHSIDYDNPLNLSKALTLSFRTLLSLEPFKKRSRLLDLCLTLPEDLPVEEVRRRLNSFMTNVLRPFCVSFIRVTGRTRKGKGRLSNLRREIKQRACAHNFGITTLRNVRDIEGYAIYLARHIDRPRLREDKKLRRVADSANFRRICMPKFFMDEPFASRWRLAVAEVAKRYGYTPSDSSRGWIWNHYREILNTARWNGFTWDLPTYLGGAQPAAIDAEIRKGTQVPAELILSTNPAFGIKTFSNQNGLKFRPVGTKPEHCPFSRSKVTGRFWTRKSSVSLMLFNGSHERRPRNGSYIRGCDGKRVR